MNVTIDDMDGDRNPTITVAVETPCNGTIHFRARVFMTKKLVKEIDDMDGWFDYHKEWSQGISDLLTTSNAITDMEICQCIVDYLNNY